MNTPEQQEELVCLLSFLSLDRNEKVSTFSDPYDRLAVSKLVNVALDILANLTLTIHVFNEDESNVLCGLVINNLEFIDEYEDL